MAALWTTQIPDRSMLSKLGLVKMPTLQYFLRYQASEVDTVSLSDSCTSIRCIRNLSGSARPKICLTDCQFRFPAVWIRGRRRYSVYCG